MISNRDTINPMISNRDTINPMISNRDTDQQQRYNQPNDQQQRYNQPNVQQRYNQPNAQQLGGYNVPSPNQRRAQTGVQPTVGATNDLNIPSRPVDRVSGGGQLGGSHFQ
jgi:hypothetical protein